MLGLFRVQSRALAAQLSDPGLSSLESKANIAHKLRGSALAIGAGRVADAALRIEEIATPTGDRGQPGADELTDLAQATAALNSAVAEAVAEIERIRG